MKSSLPRPTWVILCLLPLLTHCGGGGSSDTPATSPSTPPIPTTPGGDPWLGTGYIKQEQRNLFVGKPYGMARAAAMGQFDLCNEYRKGYKLAPVLPPEEVLAGMDTLTIERHYDSGQALNRTSGYTLEARDLQRWLEDWKASKDGTPPTVPPDCSLYTRHDIVTGTLWAGGVVYSLGSDGKATGTHRSDSLTSRDIFKPEDIPLLKPAKIGDEACLLSSAATPLGNSTACFSTRFPLKAYLSWPWLLEAKTYSGSGESAAVTDLKTVDASFGKPSPVGLFRVPDGYTVVMLD
ncbi:MAG TPA: hypothetical protein VK195_07505 [Burkholderiaceae bacterium]|nr:hypothetical protein [Burkholderiaceae bacterium]